MSSMTLFQNILPKLRCKEKTRYARKPGMQITLARLQKTVVIDDHRPSTLGRLYTIQRHLQQKDAAMNKRNRRGSAMQVHNT